MPPAQERRRGPAWEPVGRIQAQQVAESIAVYVTCKREETTVPGAPWAAAWSRHTDGTPEQRAVIEQEVAESVAVDVEARSKRRARRGGSVGDERHPVGRPLLTVPSFVLRATQNTGPAGSGVFAKTLVPVLVRTASSW